MQPEDAPQVKDQEALQREIFSFKYVVVEAGSEEALDIKLNDFNNRWDEVRKKYRVFNFEEQALEYYFYYRKNLTPINSTYIFFIGISSEPEAEIFVSAKRVITYIRNGLLEVYNHARRFHKLSPVTESDLSEMEELNAEDDIQEEIQLELPQYSYKYVVMTFQDDKEFEMKLKQFSRSWDKVNSELLVFNSAQEAFEYYCENMTSCDRYLTYIFTIILSCGINNETFVNAKDIASYLSGLEGYDSATSYKDFYRLNIIKKTYDQLHSPEQKAKFLLKNRKQNFLFKGKGEEWLHKQSFPLMLESYEAFKIFFSENNRIIQSLIPLHILELWNKYSNDIINECIQANGASGVEHHLYLIFFMRSKKFAIEVYRAANDELKKDKHLLVCANIEKNIVAKILRRSTITIEVVYDLLKIDRWRKKLKVSLLHKILKPEKQPKGTSLLKSSKVI